MSKEQFIQDLEKIKGKVVDSFQNEHGENYVIYYFPEVWAGNYFVTGDELEWEIGWNWDKTMMLKQEFKLSPQEFLTIDKLIEGRGASNEPK